MNRPVLANGILKGIDFAGHDFRGWVIKGMTFIDCNFTDCDTENARITGCLFQGGVAPPYKLERLIKECTTYDNHGKGIQMGEGEEQP